MRLASAWTMIVAVLALLTGGWVGTCPWHAEPAQAQATHGGHHHPGGASRPMDTAMLGAAAGCIAVDLPAPAAPLARPFAIETPAAPLARIDGGDGVTVPPPLGPPRSTTL